jgi:hypothetical protein
LHVAEEGSCILGADQGFVKIEKRLKMGCAALSPAQPIFSQSRILDSEKAMD